MGEPPKPKAPKDAYPTRPRAADSGVCPRHIFINRHFRANLGCFVFNLSCSDVLNMVFPQEKRIQLYEMASRFDGGVPHNPNSAYGRASRPQNGKFLWD